tara:strand:- start:3768 stop:3869 length:102 start_codon:yes stop_codon:yes gene_type:complete
MKLLLILFGILSGIIIISSLFVTIKDAINDFKK